VNRTTAIVFDTNLLGGVGAPAPDTLALIEGLVDAGNRVIVPEPVVHEMAAHVRGALSKAKADLENLHALGLSEEIGSVADGAFDRLVSLLGSRGAVIVAPRIQDYADAIVAQIYGSPPADRKQGVTTGAVDALVLRCAVNAENDGFDPVLVSNDTALASAARDRDITVSRNLGEVRKLLSDVSTLAPLDALDAFRAVRNASAWRGVIDALFGDTWGITRVVGFSTALRVRGATVIHAFLHLVPPHEQEPATLVSVAGALEGSTVTVAGTATTARAAAYDSPHRTASQVFEEELQFVPPFLRPAGGGGATSLDGSLTFNRLPQSIEILAANALVRLDESTEHREGSAVVAGEVVEWSDELPHTSAVLERAGVRERINLEYPGSVAQAMLSAVMD